MATISDIAKQAGVSIATVSRVINGNGYVKDATRRKVEEAISRNHYRPNAVARSLIKKDSSMIGIVMPGRVNPFFMNIVDRVESRAEERGLSILFHNTAEQPEKEHKALRMALEQQVKGILMTPVIGSDERTRRLLGEIERAGIPVVLIDRDLHGAPGSEEMDGVFIDNTGAIFEGAKALYEAGHQKIAVLVGPGTSREGRTRLDGYRRFLREFGLEEREEYIRKGEFSTESGYRICGELMELRDPPTAVFATNSSQTLGCIRYFSERCMTLGRDIGLIGFDDIATLELMGYPVSVIERPMKDMGELAFDMLVERMEHGEAGQRRREVILNTRMILRGTEQRGKES